MDSLYSLKMAIAPYPKVLSIEFTANCNLKCPFCTRHFLSEKPKGNMDLDVFYDIVKQIEKIPTIKDIYIFGAGEPLMHPHFDEMVASLRKIPARLGTSTNVTYILNHLDALANLDYVQLSIEGWDEATYQFFRRGNNFHEIVSNLEAVKDYLASLKNDGKKVPEIWIHTLLMQNTDINQFIHVWGGFVDKIRISPMYPVLYANDSGKFVSERNEELENEYIEFKKKKGLKFCPFPFTTLSINHKGEVLSCCGDFLGMVKIGDYRDLQGAFYSKKMKRVRQEFYFQTLNTCKGCSRFLKVDKEAFERVIETVEKNNGSNPKIVPSYYY